MIQKTNHRQFSLELDLSLRYQWVTEKYSNKHPYHHNSIGREYNYLRRALYVPNKKLELFYIFDDRVYLSFLTFRYSDLQYLKLTHVKHKTRKRLVTTFGEPMQGSNYSG